MTSVREPLEATHSFTTKTLGEICDEVQGVIRTGPFGSQLHEGDYVDAGIPVVMPKNIINGAISVADIAYIGEDDAARLSQHRLKSGDIVYGRRGDIGRRAFVEIDQEGWLCGTGCLRISLGDGVVDPRYLYYYLGQTEVVDRIASQAIGTTMLNLNTSILRSVVISFPDLQTQKTISAVLHKYDRLIENNERRIALLEDFLGLVFEEWFIRCRAPGIEGCEFIESEAGQIPRDWRVVGATDAIEFNPRVKIEREGDKPFVPMGSLSNVSMLIDDIEMRSGNSGAKFQNGDTLFARITPCLENGKTGYVQFLPSPSAVAFGSTEFIVLRSKTLCPEYVYLLARSARFREHAIRSMSGATGRQRVQESCFNSYALVQPSRESLDRFSTLTQPVFKQIQTLSQKCRNLRITRDLLLPKLISGEIRVDRLDLDEGGAET